MCHIYSFELLHRNILQVVKNVHIMYMARLGHGMCHIEFLELLFKSILTEYLKMSLLMMYMQSILTIYIKMGTIKYMA